MEEFKRIKRLPPYVFSIVNELKVKARARGEDIIDFGMGNPDLATPDHVVDKLVEAARNPRNHRYSASRGITKLRRGICDWYRRRYAVELDPDTEAIATIGAKEGSLTWLWPSWMRETWPWFPIRVTRSTRIRSSSRAATCATCGWAGRGFLREPHVRVSGVLAASEASHSEFST